MGGGRYPEPLLGMLPCRDVHRTCAVQTSRSVVRVSGGCAPPASQFVNASAGAGRPPGHLLPAAVYGAGPWLRASRYFPVYGWALALTGGCQLAGGVPRPTTQLQRSLELLHTLITQHVPVCLSDAAGPSPADPEIGLRSFAQGCTAVHCGPQPGTLPSGVWGSPRSLRLALVSLNREGYGSCLDWPWESEGALHADLVLSPGSSSSM